MISTTSVPTLPAGAVPVRVAHTRFGAGSAPISLAEEHGFFAQRGLDVDRRELDRPGDIARAVVAREVDIALCGGTAVLAAAAAGGDPVMLRSIEGSNRYGIIGAPGVTGPGDLLGATIGVVGPGEVDHLIARRALRGWGLDPERDVITRACGSRGRAWDALLIGDVQAMASAAPQPFLARRRGLPVLKDFAAAPEPFQMGGIVTTRRFADERPDVVRAFLAAIEDAVDLFRTDARRGAPAPAGPHEARRRRGADRDPPPLLPRAGCRRPHRGLAARRRRRGRRLHGDRRHPGPRRAHRPLVPAPGKEPRLITDVHAHILTPSIVQAAIDGRELDGISFSLSPEGYLVSRFGDERVRLTYEGFPESVEGRIARMDAMGVDHHLLSLSPGIHWYGTEPEDAVAHARTVNDELAEIVASHPDRFSALAYLPLRDPQASVKELHRAVRELGFAGAIVGTNVNGKDWDDPELFPILEAATDLQKLVFVHPARIRGRGFLDRYHLKNLLGNPLETAVTFCSLVFGGVLDRLPDLDVLLAHGGGFACTGIGRIDHGYAVRPEASEEAASIPSAYLKRLAVDSLVHSPETLRLVIERVGIERVMLGTDYPADMGQPDPVAWIRGAGLTPEQEEAILSGNVARYLGGTKEASTSASKSSSTG